MRVAIVTESFLPTISGVTTSVLRILDHLALRGHDALVIAPQGKGPSEYRGFPVHRMPAVAYRQFPVGIPSPAMQRVIAEFAPDVVHAASPFLLGAQAITVAERLGLPSVAVFQTDVARYALRGGLGTAAAALAWKMIRRIHAAAGLTLVPSEATLTDLERAGVERLAKWGRGVDSVRYHPNNRDDPATRLLHARLARSASDDVDRVVVGYVGRLAAEKEVSRLAALKTVRGMQLVVIGDGPDRKMLGRRLRALDPVFLGALHGPDLARAYAALDVFVHPGTTETFGQTLQEAHASGLPVVAPDAGGPVDLVRPGVDGFLFDPHDDRTLRRAVSLLVADPGLRARFGESGRRAVLDRTWENLGDQLLGHYDSVIRDRRVAEIAAGSSMPGPLPGPFASGEFTPR